MFQHASERHELGVVVDQPPLFRNRGLPAWQARRITSFVAENLEQRLTVAELARHVSLSDGQFCRVFKQTFGVTAHAYVMRSRIRAAQMLMLSSGKTLSEIAMCCGMSDQSHFTRWFRRIVGETPYAWRRRHPHPPVAHWRLRASVCS
jgi:AraC-like DNA-binding protein